MLSRSIQQRPINRLSGEPSHLVGRRHIGPLWACALGPAREVTRSLGGVTTCGCCPLALR
jgi:hypothetical protein